MTANLESVQYMRCLLQQTTVYPLFLYVLIPLTNSDSRPLRYARNCCFSLNGFSLLGRLSSIKKLPIHDLLINVFLPIDKLMIIVVDFAANRLLISIFSKPEDKRCQLIKGKP